MPSFKISKGSAPARAPRSLPRLDPRQVADARNPGIQRESDPAEAQLHQTCHAFYGNRDG
jgi:hypothetical protein